MVTSSLVPSVLFTSSVSTQQLKAIRAFFFVPASCSRSQLPALKIISSTLLQIAQLPTQAPHSSATALSITLS